MIAEDELDLMPEELAAVEALHDELTRRWGDKPLTEEVQREVEAYLLTLASVGAEPIRVERNGAGGLAVHIPVEDVAGALRVLIDRKLH